MGRRTEQRFFKGEIQMAKKTQKEIFNILSHKGNANQNYIKIPPHSYYNGYHQEYEEQEILLRMWGKKNPKHCWWECKLIQPLWKTVWRLLKKLKIELPYDPTIPLLRI
jgi:hypothetical protein